MANLEKILMKGTGRLIEEKETPPKFVYSYKKIPLSMIGEGCIRKLFLQFRWTAKAKPVSAKLQRIFDRGNDEERVIISDLEKVGVSVSGTQDWIEGYAKHSVGKCDGVAKNIHEGPKTPTLLEFKTAKESDFKRIVKNTLRTGYWQHWMQCQMYMHYKKLTRAFYVVTNKNTQDRYYERFEYNKDDALHGVRIEQEVLFAETPPMREAAYNRDYYKCSFCDFHAVCYEDELPEQNCRTCRNVDLCMEGIWKCGLTDTELNYEQQAKGCTKYVRLF